MNLLGWLRVRLFPRKFDHRNLHPIFVPTCVACQLARIERRNNAAKDRARAKELATIRRRPLPSTSEGFKGFDSTFTSIGTDSGSADSGVSTDSFSAFDGGSSGGGGASGDF